MINNEQVSFINIKRPISERKFKDIAEHIISNHIISNRDNYLMVESFDRLFDLTKDDKELENKKNRLISYRSGNIWDYYGKGSEERTVKYLEELMKGNDVTIINFPSGGIHPISLIGEKQSIIQNISDWLADYLEEKCFSDDEDTSFEPEEWIDVESCIDCFGGIMYSKIIDELVERLVTNYNDEHYFASNWFIDYQIVVRGFEEKDLRNNDELGGDEILDMAGITFKNGNLHFNCEIKYDDDFTGQNFDPSNYKESEMIDAIENHIENTQFYDHHGPTKWGEFLSHHNNLWHVEIVYKEFSGDESTLRFDNTSSTEKLKKLGPKRLGN